MRAPADFVYRIPDGLSSSAAAPLLCAGECGVATLRRLTDLLSGAAIDATPTCAAAAAAAARPAGVTVYAPLRKHITHPGCKVAILGVGGLGHLAVQFASAMGADVSVLSGSCCSE
jgi:uncharacterized zinc-type alcohol dehydrogenase-like protein